MDPTIITLSKPEDIHKIFREYQPHPPLGWWYRGQSDAEWTLLPKAGRPDFYLPGVRHLGRFQSWTNNAVAYLPDLPKNDWERLAVAQHFGLVTCLLDWTLNPLVALYFSCFELSSTDGAVYCYDPDKFIKIEHMSLKEAELDGVGFIPRAISTRILNQKAVFSVHLPPNRQIKIQESDLFEGMTNLTKVIIPSALKAELLEMLNNYGINRVTLFPDLDGLSTHVNWGTMKMVKRKSAKKHKIVEPVE